ncbi:MAG: hypothetical protein HFJ52_02335 [Clostridia bacterium]|nr:hypothetical protein [Clostridia bacterium]
MYLEGKSYQAISNILNKEKVLAPKKWIDTSIEKIINNKIYIGDFERYKRTDSKETILYQNVVEPIISRAMFDDVQAQKEKNQRTYCRDRVYIFMQKVVCPKCGKLMTCKGTGGLKRKYMYYYCNECNLYLREDLIEQVTMPMIINLIEYDMTVKKYFFPVLADKKEKNTSKLDKEISSLQNQKTRIKDAYLKGIVEMEDFSEDYKIIEDKLKILEQKRLEIIDINKQTFSPQSLMADRDVEKEKLIRSNKFKDMLMAEWNSKTKEEKQEFISKFIESVTIDKDKRGYYTLENIKFRKNYIDQLVILLNKGMFEVAIPCTKGKEETTVTSSVLMDKKELGEYMDRLNDYYDVSYYELKRLDEPKKGYQKKYFTIDLVNNNGEKFFKLVELIRR